MALVWFWGVAYRCCIVFWALGFGLFAVFCFEGLDSPGEKSGGWLSAISGLSSIVFGSRTLVSGSI